MSFCEECLRDWTNEFKSMASILSKYSERDPLLTIAESAMDVVVDERWMTESIDKNSFTNHILRERSWRTICGKFIDDMEVQTYLGVLDGIGLMLLESSRSDNLHLLKSFVDRKLSRAEMEKVFNANRVDVDLIRQMAKDSDVRKICSMYSRAHPERDRILIFEAVHKYYLNSKKAPRTRFPSRKTSREYITGICPSCRGKVIPTGQFSRRPSRIVAETRLPFRPLTIRKEWSYESEFRCSVCGRKWSKSDVLMEKE